MAYTRVKICGITRAEDAVRAGELGVDAIGLNFVGGPRLISGEQAVSIVEAMSPLCTAVALLLLDRQYMQPWSDAIELIGQNWSMLVRFRVRQVYGFTAELLNQTKSEFGQFPKWGISPDIFLPMSVSNRASVRDLKTRVSDLRMTPGAVLLDTASKSALGGTGMPFDWNWIAEARAAGELEGLPPIILAGGLTPENVAEAVRIVQPYAVDVSSGVEVAGKPGIKDAIKMRDFIQAARGV